MAFRAQCSAPTRYFSVLVLTLVLVLLRLIQVRVKNSYNIEAAGTLITRERDMAGSKLTSIVVKEVRVVSLTHGRLLHRLLRLRCPTRMNLSDGDAIRVCS